MRHVTSLVFAVALSGCLSHFSASMLGITPGGVQDMNHARMLIEDGFIPDREAYTVEGLFSEHDLPLSGPTCESDLCPRASVALHQSLDSGRQEALVQLGFATAIGLEDLERPDLNVAVAIDVSGSMDGEPLKRSKESLLAMIDELGPNDEMALVSFGERAKVNESRQKMDEDGKRAMVRAVEQLKSRGSTNMEAGMRLAFQELEGATVGPERHSRVFLLTDAQPNVGMTGPDSFSDLTRDAAEQDMALTVWGVGIDLGSELVNVLSTIRGANAYHFSDVSDMEDRVRDGFTFMVTPVAYDLAAVAIPGDGLEISRTWGAPLDPAEVQMEFGASTLFFSEQAGGMGVSLQAVEGEPRTAVSLLDVLPEWVAGMDLTWTTAEGVVQQETIDVVWLGGTTFADDVTSADQVGPYRMAALTDEIDALNAAADFCSDQLSHEAALDRVFEAQARLQSRSSSLKDANLLREAELLTLLLENLHAGQSRCI